MVMLAQSFFNRDPCKVAATLLGKVLRHQYKGVWLACQIIETEAYYVNEKGSHSSLGYTEKRKAMFMPPGTIYMYYARGGDSLNISARGKGNAVLIKSAVPWVDKLSPEANIKMMQKLNPVKGSSRIRSRQKLCSGQTLLCNALHLKVKEWDQKNFDANAFYIDDVDKPVTKLVQTTRLGIPADRDSHLMYRFIHHAHAASCTSNPLTKRDWKEGTDYVTHYLPAAR